MGSADECRADPSRSTPPPVASPAAGHLCRGRGATTVGSTPRSPQAGGDLLGDGHRAVAPAGAAEGEREVGSCPRPRRRAAAASSRPSRRLEERPWSRAGRARSRRTGVVEAGEGPQLLDPVRVGQEAAVEHEVDVERAGRACSRTTRPWSACRPSASSSPNRSRMRSRSWWTLRSVVSTTTSASAFTGSSSSRSPLDGLGRGCSSAARAGGGGGCSRSGGPAPRCWPRGRAMPHPGARRPQRRRGPAAPRRGTGRCRRRAPTRSMVELGARGQLGHLRDERGRQVVDHEPAEVLEVVRGLRRPAPDRPVMTTNSLTIGYERTAFSHGGRAAGGWWRPAAYSAARARNPGGGAGSSMRSGMRPGVGQRVHVAGQRPVDEADEHALLHLLDRRTSSIR